VNSFATGNQLLPSVGLSSSGGFVVVWQSAGQDGSAYGVFGRRYDSAGTPIGSDFQVNTYTTGSQYSPSITVTPSGTFVVAWASPQDGSGAGIFARRYDSSGTPLGAEFQVNTYTTGSQRRAKVATDNVGNFVIAWHSPQDGSQDAVIGRRYNSSGAPLGGEFQVNNTTTGYQVYPNLAIDGSGRFVVAWFSPQDGSGYGVVARRYSSAGVAQGSEFQVNTFTPSSQSYPSVAAASTGNFVVTWSSYLQDGSSTGIYGQRYSGIGLPLASEFLVNSYTTNRQAGSVLATDGATRLVVIWRSTLQDGSGDGVYGQLFCVPGGASCDDGNPCTTDSCNLGVGCVHTNNTAPCDDGSACTTSDT